MDWPIARPFHPSQKYSCPIFSVRIYPPELVACCRKHIGHWTSDNWMPPDCRLELDTSSRGGTAPSLLVFFSSTNPHYLLAKPDSKGLSTANLPPSCSSGNVRPNLAVPIPHTGIPPKQTLKLKWFDPPYWIFYAWIKFRMAYQHCLNQFCAFSIYHLPEQVPPNSNSKLLCMKKTAEQKCIISAFSPDPSSIIVYPCQ